MSGVYASLFVPGAVLSGIGDTAALQALKGELNALREESQALKKQTGKAAVANGYPSCRPPDTGTHPSESGAAASVSQPAKQAATKNDDAPRMSVAALSGPVGQTSSPERVETPPREVLRLREVLTPKAPTPVAKAETRSPPTSSGRAIVEVRTSQERLVPGVQIAFHFSDEGSKLIGNATVTTNASGRSNATIPTGTAGAECHLSAEVVQAERAKPGTSSATGLPLTPGLFRTCGEILAQSNGINGAFTIDRPVRRSPSARAGAFHVRRHETHGGAKRKAGGAAHAAGGTRPRVHPGRQGGARP
jgi:hypothetical protein